MTNTEKESMASLSFMKNDLLRLYVAKFNLDELFSKVSADQEYALLCG
jgi:hypothetical protein